MRQENQVENRAESLLEKSPEILIADDTVDSLRLLSEVLRDQGYAVRSVVTGTLALSSVQASQPDLILLDILMPGKSGYEVCQALKADPKTRDIPVIFLSALNEPFDKVKAFDIGGVDFITKPFQVEEVLVRVRNQLDLYSARDQILKLNSDLGQRVRRRTQQLEQANRDLCQEITERHLIEQNLRESEEKFRQISEHVSEVFWLTEYDTEREQCTNIAYVSPAYESIWGVSRNHIYHNPWQWTTYICDQDRQRVEEAFETQVAQGQFDEEYKIIRPDGSTRWIRDRGFPVYNSSGQVYRIAGIAEDITAQKQAELERDRFFNLSLDLLFIANHRGQLKRINPVWEKNLGYQSNELLDQSLRTFVHPNDRALVRSSMQALRRGQDVNGIEIRLCHRNGTEIWTAWNIAAFPQENLIYGTGRDITKRKAAEEQLVYETLHDSLTGLDNRTHFMKRLELALKKRRRHGHLRFAVLFIDLDGFKRINDTLGHAIGDQLLIHVAEILQGCVRETDSVARLGGDEFTILLEDLQTLRQVIDVVERIQGQLKSPIQIGPNEVYTSASIGIVLSSLDYEKIADILRNADIAMYQAKAKGKDCYEVFDKEMYTQTLHLVEIENHLRHAIQNQELQLYYQPIIHLEQQASSPIEGFEVLLRWFHPQKGLISPSEFIPIAEDTGLINPIGEWVLHQACLQLQRWEKLHPEWGNLYLSVNISGRQLREPGLPEMIDRVLQETQLRPDCLKLEITESSLIETPHKVIKSLEKIRTRGVCISLDDFGTGFSSFSYLHQFPIDVLKIDRAFIQTLNQGSREQNIVRSIIGLAKNLGIGTVAEGIETYDQWNALSQMQCDAGQGFLFSKPLALSELHQVWETSFNLLGQQPKTLDSVGERGTVPLT